MRINHFILVTVSLLLMSGCGARTEKEFPYNVPEEYLEEADEIPVYWVSTLSEVEFFLKNNVKKGQLEMLGKSAGGRPIYAVSYGKARQGKGTSTYSGASSVNKIAAYRGPDNDKKVYMTIAGIHGFELEGIVGAVNMISVFETGKDLNGTEWPELESMLDSIDRIVIMPLCNPDGRCRVPIRMEKFRGHEPDAYHVHEYLNTGGRDGGKLIGWPDCKEYVPIPFDEFEFPGTYPNDNGYNLMHDNFFGQMQPENVIICGLVEREKPDIITNMHTGVPRNNYFMNVLSPTIGAFTPMLVEVWKDYYIHVHTDLTLAGLKKTDDVSKETEIRPLTGSGSMNLTSVLAFQCGALSVTIEDASHGYTGVYDDGTPVEHDPLRKLKSQLTAHQSSMQFLNRNGGVAEWEKIYK